MRSKKQRSQPKLSRLELEVMGAFWSLGPCSVREIQEHYPEKGRPAYTTVQTIVYRLETKGAVRRKKKIGNAHIFEAVISPDAARRPIVDELLALFGGRPQPLISHLIETGRLTMDDIEAARRALEELSEEEKEEKEEKE